MDPGLVTGYAIWNGGVCATGELRCDEFLLFAAKLIEDDEVDTVVSERFIYSAATGKLSTANWSLEQIGVLRFLCERSGIRFVLQNVADAKRFGTDSRLDFLHWPKPAGAGHARDAERHLLVFLVNSGEIDGRVFVTR